MTSSTRTAQLGRRGLLLGLTATVVLTGCTPVPASGPSAQPSPRPSTSAAPTAQVVPGYDVGQFPPVPLFVLPDLSLLDTSTSAFTIAVNEALVDIPGVRVAPAHCDAGGSVISGNGTAYLYGDGSGAFTGADGTVQNFGDGSGNSIINGVTIQNFGDGSGNYTDGTVTIQNFGDGSGDYTDGIITIHNFGDGTALVDGDIVEAAPLAQVPKLGSFPPLEALAPLESCGTTLSFEDGVLFDFGKSDIRADAAATLDAIAAVFDTLEIAQAQVSGHTDSIGAADDNQTLSEARAASVVAALEQRGTDTSLTAAGFGEERPVAANEIGGQDNPAGRQLNRRVEIFIPATF